MNALYEDRDAAASAAEKIKVFAQPQRLMILSCLLRGERNVGEIATATGIGQPALSQQLAELRRADLVQTRKEAKQVWYRLADEAVALCIRHIEAMFGGIGDPAPLPTGTAATQVSTQASTADGVAGFASIV